LAWAEQQKTPAKFERFHRTPLHFPKAIQGVFFLVKKPLSLLAPAYCTVDPLTADVSFLLSKISLAG
jgi:hypothetical protein